MNLFGNDRKRKNPFGFFDMDEEFERMFQEMEKMIERTFRGLSLDLIEPGKSFVYGYNIRVGTDGKPKIQEFGNRPTRMPNGDRSISDEREPLTDVIEGKDEVYVTVEIPGVEKEDVDLSATSKTLMITVDAPQRRYHKLINLPCDVNPKTTKATYKNGVLDVTIKRKEKKDGINGYRVNIE